MAEPQNFRDELVKAGVVAGSGRLSPSSQGKRVQFDGKKRRVIDGPFAESKELVAGYWLWQGGSIDEGPGWVKTGPHHGGGLRGRENATHEGVWKGGGPGAPEGGKA